MTEGKSLKEQNSWLIRSVMIGHVIAFALVATDPLHLQSLGGSALIAKLEAVAATNANAMT